MFSYICRLKITGTLLSSFYCLDPAGASPAYIPEMADAEEVFGLLSTPSDSDSKELNDEGGQENRIQTSCKSPSAKTSYIQQVSKIALLTTVKCQFR